MKKNTKRNQYEGFTLVELLAVIVILAIILVIAVPKVMSIIDDAKMGTLESTAKMIASAAEKTKIQNAVLGKTETITCESVAKLNDVDYEECSIEFDGDTAKVTIQGSGKFQGLNICGGTKTNVVVRDSSCPIEYGVGSIYVEKLLAKESTLHNGLIKDDTDDKNIRYAGSIDDVKNKVYFNCKETDSSGVEYGVDNYDYASSCEIWRIIGVFNTKSTSNETEDPVPRIKIVRDAALDTKIVWDTTDDGVDYINQWGETTLASDDITTYNGASLKQYLNDGEDSYYNSLSSIAKGQIENALWYTGAVTVDTASGVYEDERSNATGTGTTINYTTTWAGKIGLIYISDFGYAGTNCGSYTIYYYDDANSCGKNRNWLVPFSGVHYWTMSSSASDSNYVWLVYSDGYADSGITVKYTSLVRPTTYLSSSVQIIGGDGFEVPYKLK